MSRTDNAMGDAGNRNAAAIEPKGDEPDVTAPVVEARTGDQLAQGMQTELADTKEKLLRALADQQNIRRQMQRERDDAVRFAGARLAEDLLDTLDNLRRAIESVPVDASSEEVKPLLAGVEATERNLLEMLARHGVQKIDPFGLAFDPHHHHAIFQRPDSIAAEGTIIEVLQPGYMLHGRLLRPAMVGVAVPG